MQSTNHSLYVRRSLFLLFLVPLLFVTINTSWSQSRSDGSIYSRFGLGERSHFLSSQSQALGGSGIALGSFRYANLVNPAALSDQFFTRVNGGMTFERLTSSADGVDDSQLSSGQFNAIHMSFPIRTRRTGIAFGFKPFTHVNYRVDKTHTLLTDPGSGTETPVLTSFQGNGGLHELSGAIGQRLHPALSAGISVRYVFGILEQSQRTTFNNVRFTDSDIVNATRLDGVAFTAGLRYQTQTILGVDRPFAAGLAVTLPSALSGDQVVTFGAGSVSDTLTVGGAGDIDLPVQVIGGFMFQPSVEWTVVADVHFEEWSSVSSDFALPGLSAASRALQDRTRLSAGAEFWPGARRPFGPYFVRMAYRFGVYTDRAYNSPNPGERINSVGVTGGLSVPTGIPGTTIDLNIDVGRRGTTSDGLVKDRYIRFGLNINFGERWFDRLPLG